MAEELAARLPVGFAELANEGVVICAILDDVDVVEDCFEMFGFYTPVDEAFFEGFRCKTRQLEIPK
jgi:hypothetical protein